MDQIMVEHASRMDIVRLHQRAEEAEKEARQAKLMAMKESQATDRVGVARALPPPRPLRWPPPPPSELVPPLPLSLLGRRRRPYGAQGFRRMNI